jgi:hypothetical protein
MQLFLRVCTWAKERKHAFCSCTDSWRGRTPRLGNGPDVALLRGSFVLREGRLVDVLSDSYRSGAPCGAAKECHALNHSLPWYVGVIEQETPLWG